MLEDPRYIEGVRKAQEREQARTALIEDRWESFCEFHEVPDKPAAEKARKAAEVRRKRYGN